MRATPPCHYTENSKTKTTHVSSKSENDRATGNMTKCCYMTQWPANTITRLHNNRVRQLQGDTSTRQNKQQGHQATWQSDQTTTTAWLTMSGWATKHINQDKQKQPHNGNKETPTKLQQQTNMGQKGSHHICVTIKGLIVFSLGALHYFTHCQLLFWNKENC